MCCFSPPRRYTTFLPTYRIGSTAANAEDLDDTGTETTVGHEGDGAALFHAATQVAGFSADSEEGTILSVLARPFVSVAAATLQIHERILTGLAH